MKLIAAIALALVIASPVAARANASITGPDGYHFGETAGVTFDAGHARVDPFNWWARVDCYASATELAAHRGEAKAYRVIRTNGRVTFAAVADADAIYAEMLHLGDQAGYPVNDNLATFGPTPSWSSGGSVCTVTLLAYDGNGRFIPYATDDFEVLP